MTIPTHRRASRAHHLGHLNQAQALCLATGDLAHAALDLTDPDHDRLARIADAILRATAAIQDVTHALNSGADDDQLPDPARPTDDRDSR
jgi:hypothetical protein